MTELKALIKLVGDLEKLRAKANEKVAKEKLKNSKKYIRFKGCDCYTHEDIDDVYRYDGCTNSECDKAHDRLDKLLGTNVDGKTLSECYVKIISNVIVSLKEEIRDKEFDLLPSEEKTRILTERNKEAGLDY
jgi:hypothetical protein